MQTTKTKLYKVTLLREQDDTKQTVYVACDEFRYIDNMIYDRGYTNSIISGTELITNELIIEKTEKDGD